MQATVVDKLRSIVGNANVLTGVALSPYVVEGRTPDAAVFPRAIEEIRAIVRLAADAEVPLIAWGGGTAAGVGMPTASTGVVLGLTRMNRIVEHEPGDLTVTAEAGVTLAELQRALAVHGQWLSLDPPDAERATLGGVVAANASGPRRQLYGTMRDLLIGVTIVTADGTIVRGGARVVKNVAGYDVPKLFVGSFGTLGVIVDATVKLRPRTDAERFVAIAFDQLKDASSAIRALMTSDAIPEAIELLDAEAARTIGLPAHASLVVGFDGLAEQVEWACRELARIATSAGGREARDLVPEQAARIARAAHDAFTTPASIMRFSVLPTQVIETMEQAATAARSRGFGAAWSAHAGVGIVTGVLGAPGETRDVTAVASVLQDWRGIAHANDGYAVLERAPLAVKEIVPVWDEPGAAVRIMKRIKAEFDPKNILNPGRFVAGI